MNYVIINGKRSDSITGLLIQNLPPISKPLLRTEIEEIDGRDGDIVTPLGYSAYEKDMTIGLYGKFDINKVISFFDSKGTVIFSNEADKIYRFQIIEQIDFERLIRFRTATVTFHVQPFKLSAVDGVYTYTNQLFKPSAYSKTEKGMSISVMDGGLIEISGTSSETAEFFIPFSMELPSGNYNLTAVGDFVTGRVGIGLIGDTGNYGLSYYTGNLNHTFNIPVDTKVSYLWLCVYGEQTISSVGMVVSLLGKSLNVTNRGNAKSKPVLTIYGSGKTDISINSGQPVSINLSTNGIKIDVEEMQAYFPDGSFANRRVSGDYEDLMLQPGHNVLSWDGDVTKVTIGNYSRWI